MEVKRCTEGGAKDRNLGWGDRYYEGGLEGILHDIERMMKHPGAIPTLIVS